MNKEVDPFVTIIVIDYKKTNPYLIECLEAIEKQTYKNFEIILESDHPLQLKYPKLKIVDYKGKYIPPANKRDHAGKIAKGEILAFIDDDAFPDKNWLKNLVRHFSKLSIVAVGGPGITPPNVSWKEACSGWASASPVGAGPYTYRFLPDKVQYVDDYPSMNLAVRKDDFIKVGGYDSNFWPGEDTKLCLDLVSKTNKKIIYDPEVIVFHHRRPIWKGHLRQNGNFGLHRGFFARVLPQTSFRITYFLPSSLLVGLLLLPWLYLFDTPLITAIRTIGSICTALYFLLLIINALWIFLKSKSVLQTMLSIPVIFTTHLWYGVRFVQGYLFTAKLKR